MQGNQLEARVADGGNDVADLITFTGSHKNGSGQALLFKCLIGENIEAGLIRVRDLDIFSENFQTVKLSRTRSSNGSNRLILLLRHVACRCRCAGHFFGDRIRQVFCPPLCALRQSLDV